MHRGRSASRGLSAGNRQALNMARETFIGFDSAWTDKPRAPGAICAMVFEEGRPIEFHEPRLASFAQALEFIEQVRPPDGLTLVALDQPTIVPNSTSLRPVERVVASLVSWLGGGVQPSNTSKRGMFCKDAPIWPFLAALGAVDLPEEARTAGDGLYLMEVFPALALPSFSPEFFGRLAAPRYNPKNRSKFRQSDWVRVAQSTAAQFEQFGAEKGASWCRKQAESLKPSKADQDRLDAMLCLLVAMTWRLRPRSASMLVGDLASGYMVFPASQAVRARITSVAQRCGAFSA